MTIPETTDAPAYREESVASRLRSRVDTSGIALPALIGLLLSVHLAVQFAVRPYPRWGDAILVLAYARDFPEIPPDHHSLRVGVIFPARVAIELFGFGQVAYYFFPFVTGVLLVVATFFVGLRLFGVSAAVVAGLLVIFNPVLVRTTGNTTSWHLLSDVPSAAFFTAGLALLLEGIRRREAGTAGGRLPAGATWFMAAGAALGWAYLCREFVAFLYVIVPLVFLLWRVPWRHIFFVAVPMLGALLVELVTAWVVWGDPLIRLQISSEHSSKTEPVPRSETVTRFTDALFHEPRGSVSILLIAMTLGGALLLWRKETTLPAVWFVSFWFPLTAMGGLLDPTESALRLHLLRYWVPIIPAIAIGAAGATTILLRAFFASLEGRERKVLAVRLAALAVLAGAWYVKPMVEIARTSTNDVEWNALRTYLSEHDEIERITTDYRTGEQLFVYSYEPLGGERVWDGRVDLMERGLERPPTATEMPGTALLYSRQTSDKSPAPSDGWVMVWREGSLRLYLPEGQAL